MTIILDNVSSLFLILLAGSFFTALIISLETACLTRGSSYADVGVPSDDVPPPLPPPHGVNDAQQLQVLAVIMDNLMGLMNPCGEVYSLVEQAVHIVRGGPI